MKTIEESPGKSAVDIQELRDRNYNATLTEFRRIHERLAILRVQPDHEPTSFAAGQYTVLGLGNWEPRVEGAQAELVETKHVNRLIRRAYSVSCSILDDANRITMASDQREIEFYVALVMHNDDHAPELTPRLFSLETGDRLFIGNHFHGRYTLEHIQPEHQVVLLSTGTGEAPHNAMLAELFARHHQPGIASIVCTRLRDDLGYIEIHRKLERRFTNYHYLPITTREPENTDESHPQFVGRQYIQDYFLSGEMERHACFEFSPDSTHIFLCGNPDMIGRTRGKARPGMLELLEQRGFSIDRPRRPGNVHFESYW